MLKKQKEKIIRCLKIGKMQNGGQSLSILAKMADAWNAEVSKYLQQLKSKGLVIYFSSTKVWYWNREINENEILALKK